MRFGGNWASGQFKPSGPNLEKNSMIGKLAQTGVSVCRNPEMQHGFLQISAGDAPEAGENGFPSQPVTVEFQCA